MADFLSDDWFDIVETSAQSLDPVAGVDANLMLEIAAAPNGKMRVTAVLVDGLLQTFAIGKNADAECKIVLDASTAGAIIRGELDPEIAYMRGDVKLDGAYETALFGVRPLTRTSAWSEWVAKIAAATHW